jgi:subtilisin family serine protease
MRTYSILRNLSRPVSSDPFSAGAQATVESDVPPHPRIDVERLEPRQLRDIARDPEVAAIAPSMPTEAIEPIASLEPLAAGDAWGIAAVGADVSTATGDGTVVAVLDTGIDRTHVAFNGVTLTEMDFSGDGNGDVAGHGTHCAGTIFGRDVNGARIGVARDVKKALIGKILGNNGRGSSDMAFQGIQWAVNNNAHVISMSLGFDFPGLVKRLADSGMGVDLATSIGLEGYRANVRMFDALMGMITARSPFSEGCLVVAAAGNESRRQVNPAHEVGVSLPAAAQGIVSVGALQQGANGLSVANFSNTFPQVSAPGVDIKSAKVGGGTVNFNGTSMACPHVAGVAALWWQAVRNSPVKANAANVLARLLANAKTNGFAANVDIEDRGAGIVRAP